MDIISAIIMGIIEGLTEFLPVSSTGHMILTSYLLGLDQNAEQVKTFEIVVQLGAVLAVVVLYWRKFIDILMTIPDLFNGRLKSKNGIAPQRRLNILHIILAMLPAVVVGLILHDFIKEHLFGPMTVVYSLVVGGLLMIYAEWRKGRSAGNMTVDDITYKQAFGVGLFQCLALWPGFSRSGSTISGGLLLGISHTAAAEFTFLVSVPVMFGATGLDLVKSAQYLSMDDFGFFAAGFIAAFLVALVAIKTFLNLLKRLPLYVFAYYRFALAIIFFILLTR
ncbi:undecaprenyl-diphosphate phosphatase [Paenibacillus sp. PK4536]|uniref:undecaprenyl-diphosphate phosphatase n=1 Tax=Paenibacillus TaxID=44249 RepID=UPI0023582640|nr:MULTISPECIES: undecaprenyl-diphosphate phosphatase [Paenibacillus]WIM39990.1 undecaprenyl-diphosphate phosphatase [Paenibacillus sp. PK4536]CAJ1317666.1 undecaprenyl-diphosphate phosphatase [Paenibacillus nuruki]